MANTKKTATKKENVVQETKLESNINDQEEIAQILDKKEKRKISGNTFSILRKIGDVIFWLAFAILALVWVTDFINVNNEQDPVFCIKTEVHEYNDGETMECTGAGYKVYKYNRTSIGTGYEFGPFFIKMKDAN